ncbi:hypothetical protein M3Y99_01670700 [Aphelenchoides fujianensis]|nr:hypothetical protein M3Y99_01670700 [Aphelenchoides fujianensis]
MGGLAGGVLGLAAAALLLEWTNLHSDKLTRRERTFFDETNILATSEAFEFNLGPVLEDTTPGGSGGCCGAYPRPPTGLISSLFRDQQEEEMQKFYREHYGNVYASAKRVADEQKAVGTGEQKNKQA